MWTTTPSTCVRRRGYKHVAACGDKLTEVLRAKGPDAAVDVDHACLCETIDTIGLYGFNHSFNALGCRASPPLIVHKDIMNSSVLSWHDRC